MTTTFRYADAANSAIDAVRDDGLIVKHIPCDPANADYAAIISSGATVNPYVAPPPAVPQFISDRQFFQQLAVDGLITQAEALAAVMTGTIPASMMTLVNQIPDDQKFAAQMMLAGATIFDRVHPMTVALATAMGWSTDQVAALWQAAAAL